MAFFRAVFNGEVVAEGWAADADQFAAQKKLSWYRENGGLMIVGGYQ